MSNWTRAHDIWLAEHCEDMKLYAQADLIDGPVMENKNSHLAKCPFYLIDPAAAISAAEAWRKKAEGRYYETSSAMSDSFGDRPTSACCFHRHSLIAGAGETLAEALYNATGGPA